MSLFDELRDRFSEEDMEDTDIVARGHDAERLLADPLFTSTLEEVEAGCVIEWAESNDPENRDGLWVLLKGIEAVRAKLREYVAAKDMAKAKE